MKKININGVSYSVIKDDNGIVSEEELNEMVTDYFNDFDYIVGDIAYNKLRLKGFNDKTNPKFNKINDYNKVEEYINLKCAYSCKYFILKKD